MELWNLAKMPRMGAEIQRKKAQYGGIKDHMLTNFIEHLQSLHTKEGEDQVNNAGIAHNYVAYVENKLGLQIYSPMFCLHGQYQGTSLAAIKKAKKY